MPRAAARMWGAGQRRGLGSGCVGSGCVDMQPGGCLYLHAAKRLHVGMARMDEVFKALADASRRRLLDSLNARNGQTLRELCAGLDMARQSVSKHLTVLEAANLITTVWRGREKLHYLNA